MDKNEKENLPDASILWTRCHTFEDLTNFSNVIYLHESERGIPVFWGRAYPAVLAGSKRIVDGVYRNPHIGKPARSFAEECLRLGQSVYVGTIVDRRKDVSMLNILHYLIFTYPTKLQPRKRKTKPEPIWIEHLGTPPECIKKAIQGTGSDS